MADNCCFHAIEKCKMIKGVTYKQNSKGESMSIDYNNLRKDLADDRYAASFAGIPEMIMEAWEIESLSDEEILELARREHINLRKYEK